MNSVTLSSSYGNIAAPHDTEEGLYLHIPDVSQLDTLPEYGTISFKYKRKEIALGEDKLSARLCLLEITGVEADENCPEEKTDDVVDKLFEEAQKNKDEEDSEDE